MELNRFRPYGYTTFQEIEDKHFSQMNLFLYQYHYTKEQYAERRLPKNWHNFIFFTVHLILEIVVITGLFFAWQNKFYFFKCYNALIRDSLGTVYPEKISFCYFMVVFSVCVAYYLSFYWVMTYKLTCGKIVNEFGETMDCLIDHKSRKAFTTFFNIASLQTGINLKVIFVGLVFLTYQIGMKAFRNYMNGEYSLIFAMSLFGLYVCCQVNILFIQYTMYTLLLGLFFNLKIFRFKVKKCKKISAHLKQNARKNIWRLTGFMYHFWNTHRQIREYDDNVRIYNFDMDILTKVANMWSFFNFYKTRDIFGAIFCIIFLTMYVYSHFLGERVGFYPWLNRRMFRDLNSFVVRYSQFAFFKLAKQFRDRRTNLIKCDNIISFLASPHNKFGFGYGHQYIYTKLKVIENFLMFLYVLMLIFKRYRQ